MKAMDESKANSTRAISYTRKMFIKLATGYVDSHSQDLPGPNVIKNLWPYFTIVINKRDYCPGPEPLQCILMLVGKARSLP
jgi:hypothetical protein